MFTMLSRMASSSARAKHGSYSTLFVSLPRYRATLFLAALEPRPRGHDAPVESAN